MPRRERGDYYVISIAYVVSAVGLVTLLGFIGSPFFPKCWIQNSTTPEGSLGFGRPIFVRFAELSRAA